jgi:hypothetical protein
MKKHLYLLGILMMLTIVLSVSTPVKAATTHVSYSSHIIARQHVLASPGAQCQYQLPYPDSTCTPGAVFSNVTADQVCTPGYSSGVRNVPQSEKNAVYAEYGITSHTSGQYEIDHFIPLELGGSNDISNLWPEPASPTPGFHQKDKVENYLHDQVCSGAMSLTDAQHAIASDWVAVYNSMP